MRHAGVRIAKNLFGKVKPLTGHYRTSYGRNVRGGRSIPRADVAHCMLTVMGQPETIGQVVGIAA